MIENVGDLPIASDVPLSLSVEMRDEATGCHASTTCALRIAGPIPAAGCERVSVALDLPDRVGDYALTLTPDDGLPLELPLTVSEPREEGLSQLLEMAGAAVVAAEANRELPTDYVDVSEGLLAPLKRWLKRKLLGNFKVGYVDVTNRQQADVNRHLIDAVRQLAECCRSLERRSHMAPGLPGSDESPDGSMSNIGDGESDRLHDPSDHLRVPGKPVATMNHSPAGVAVGFIRPYFFIFLYNVTRLMPSESAARVRL